MPPSSEVVFRFGPFELDAARHRLMRGSERIPLPDTYLDLLLLFAARAGEIVSKDSLAETGWKEVVVADNNVSQAVSRLRKTLGCQEDGSPFIENIVGRGYRFVAPVAREAQEQPRASVDVQLAPYRAFVEGRAALERLDIGDVAAARQAFERALTAAPDDPAAHVGLANACVMTFESTRADIEPDIAALEQADRHARRGCELDSSSADAWSTLALVLHRLGSAVEAAAAARKAIALEPREWSHHLRLASVSWGSQRVRAAQRVLAMYPGLGLAHWFAATVYVARQQFDEAVEQLRAGCAAQDAQRLETDRFNAVGLHLLHGLVLAARGAQDDAINAFRRELSGGDGHIYARESFGNSCYAVGAVRLRQGRMAEAVDAFREALKHLPGHVCAGLGLAEAARTRPAKLPSGDATRIDVATAMAVASALDGRHADAAQLCGNALVGAASGSAGWMLPVEPLLYATLHHDAWSHALAILRHRAA